MKQKTVTVSRKALLFAADMQMSAEESTGDDGPIPSPKPITIRARTPGVAHQGYWGRCVHDMSGFVAPDGPVPLDWNHCSDSDIGVADSLTIDAEGLMAAGRLIPFSAEDRAAEIIYKGSQGVPYQASIVMDLDELVVTEIPESVSYTVNGQDFVGPLTVFSKWSIDGISILPYGADEDTSVQFGAADSEISVTVNLLEEHSMAENAPTPEAAPTNRNEAATFSREDALKFKTDFGPQGFDWYLEGKTHAEAAKLFTAQIQERANALQADISARDAEIATLKTEIETLKAKAEFRRGHPTPASARDADPTADAQKFGRSVGMQSFVNRIEASLAKAAK